MGTLCKISRAVHALSNAGDSITIDVPAGRMLLVHQGEYTGMASAAAAGVEAGIFRVTTLGSGGTPTNIPIKIVDPNPLGALPAGFTAKFGYTTAPLIEADPMHRFSFQPFGGKSKYTAMPGGALAFWSATAYQVSVRGIGSGTPNVTTDLEVELL